MRILFVALLIVACSRHEKPVAARAHSSAVPATLPRACGGAQPHDFQENGLEPARPKTVGKYEVGDGRFTPGTQTMVQAIVRSDGTVCAAEALTFPGYIRDAAAAADVLHWRFEPARANGQAVDVNMLLGVRPKFGA
jgi:hypothetical protein